MSRFYSYAVKLVNFLMGGCGSALCLATIVKKVIEKPAFLGMHGEI